LDDDPTAVNKDCYGEGWFIKMELSKTSELEDLLDSEQYKELIG
jgi:glycine cleavage system H protein